MDTEEAKAGRLARERLINSAAKKLVRDYLAGREAHPCMDDLVKAVRAFKPLARKRWHVPPEKAEDYRLYRKAGFSVDEAGEALGLHRIAA